MQTPQSRMQITESITATPPANKNPATKAVHRTDALQEYDLIEVCDNEWEAYKKRLLDRFEILLGHQMLKNVTHLANSVDAEYYDIFRAITTAKSCPHKLYKVPLISLHLPINLHEELLNLRVHDVGSLINEELRRVLLAVGEIEATVIQHIADTLHMLQEGSTPDLSLSNNQSDF